MGVTVSDTVDGCYGADRPRVVVEGSHGAIRSRQFDINSPITIAGRVPAMGRGPDDRALEPVKGLPPSAKLVYYVLRVEEPMTQADIRAATRLPARTSRDAIARLIEAGVIDETHHFADVRMKRYRPSDGEPR